MQPSVYALLFFLISSIVTVFFYRFDGVIVVVATILGFVLGRIGELQRELNELRSAMAKDWEQRNRVAKESPVSQQKNTDHNVKPPSVDTSFPNTPDIQREKSSNITDGTKLAHQQTAHSSSTTIFFSWIKASSITDRILLLIKRYFTGGNLFVRIGILILFFGISFLLKYVSDQGVFPIEYRLIAIAISAIGLLLLGWSLREKKRTYGVLLQGAGIGLLYLDIFAAFNLYHVMPSSLAFVLMFVISLFAAALAVLQDARSLAIFGFTGGFLAPILASSGSNHYVGLFSYYLILNIAIVIIAWFKAWRALNLLGFFFTFVVGAVWGYSAYQAKNFLIIEFFLIVFFLFYVFIAILFALRQPDKLRGYVDGSLLFGVPLAASGLQYALVSDIDYAISLSSFVMGSFYLVLARLLRKKAGHELLLLSQSCLALGVIFTSLAIPFALSATHTAAAWGLEGLGLIWLGVRQHRFSVRVFGLLLQTGAGVCIVYALTDRFLLSTTEIPFINAPFISAFMMAVAGILSARLLAIEFQGRKAWENTISNLLLGWGLSWLFTGTLYQVANYMDDQWLISSFMLLATATSFVFMMTVLRTKPQWKQAGYIAMMLLPVMLLSALIQADGVLGLNIHYDSPFRRGGWLAWPLAFVVLYIIIFQLDKNKFYTSFRVIIHSLTALLLVIIITWQGAYQLLLFTPQETSWMMLWFAIPATVALGFIIRSTHWPIKANRIGYLQQTGLVLVVYLMLWGLFAIMARGSSGIWQWIPLLNSLDIMLLIVFITVYKWWRLRCQQKLAIPMNQFKCNNSRFVIGITGLIFLWLNFTLFRIVSHWFDVPYHAYYLYNSNLVQTSITILWALSGMLLTLYASYYKRRAVWIAGSLLLGSVVLKLFIIDLSSLSSLARITSFLIVGVLLTSIGYFSPLPEQAKVDKQ
ncbi:MAG: DUF2339 domain-containing protein [Cocleimonas sp.]|nr:DUF2339 domain-containing protein [Cocleimonas sp.]